MASNPKSEMVLDVGVNNAAIEVSLMANTLVKPGGFSVVKIKLTGRVPLTVDSIDFTLPTIFKITGIEGGFEFPLKLGAGETLEGTYKLGTKKGKEGFGEVSTQLKFRREAGEQEELGLNFWNSVLSNKELVGVSELPDDCRKILIEVVQEREQNGHIFMAHPVNFFRDYLNIKLAPDLETLLVDSLGLNQDGLPVKEDVYKEFALGERRFFGIEKLELFPEEENIASDNFASDNFKETDYKLKL